MKQDEITYNYVVKRSQLVTDAYIFVGNMKAFLLPMPELTLVVVSALHGRGRSFGCRRLNKKLPSIILESNAMQQILFPQLNFSQAENTWLFKTIRQFAERLLRKGFCIIIDATNFLERYRGYFYGITRRLDVKLTIVSVEAQLSLAKERLTARLITPDEKSTTD